MRNHKHLLPNIILFVIFFCLIAVIFSKINTVHAEQNEVQTSLLSTNNSSVVYLEVPLDFSEDFNSTEDREELLELMKIHDARRKAAYEMLTSARALGYDADHPAIQMAKLQSLMSGEHLFYYYKKYVELGYEAFDEKAKQYPEATYIWLYLKDLGYNDYVCAGIMGNLMAEVGGQTLALKVNVSTSTHYGMCQWSKLYYGEVWGASLPNQCDFLANTIEEQLKTNRLLGNQKGGRNTFATHTVQKDESGKFVGTKKDTEEVDKEAKKRDDIKRIVRYFSQHPYDTLDTIVEFFDKVYTRDYIYACLNDPRVDELFGKLIAKAVRQQLADNRYSIMKKFEDNWGQELFVAAGLTEREIQILNLRFSNNVITSVEAVALQLQVTHQMISKIENQALGKLEEYQKQKGDVK